MILNIITFAVCLGMMILFRRIDKSNMKMTKLRRYSSKMFDDFRKLAETEKRKFKDATIEMDILIKKSNALTVNLSGSLKEVENRLSGLDIEKTNLKKVEEDIKVISHAARDVNKQIEFIGLAREEFSDLTDKITNLRENVAGIRSESNAIINGFNGKLRERSRELMEEFSSVVNEHTASFNERESQIMTLKSTLSDLENTVFADIKIKSDEMKENMSRAVKEFDDLKGGMFSRLDSEVERIHGKLKNVEDNVDESKASLIDTFESEVNRIRTEMDNLNIHAIAKKDEIVQATRKEAEDIRKKIEDFQEKVLDHENRLINTAENKISSLDSEYQAIDMKFGNLSEKIKKDFSTMEDRLAEIKSEILQYEEHNKIFTRTDSMIEKVDNSIQHLNTMLDKAHQDAVSIERFTEDAEEFKELRKAINNEIHSYQARKSKLADVEASIQNLLETSDLALTRADLMKDNMSKIDFVNARIDALSESYSDLETRIEELREYEDLITKNLESANKSEILVKSVDTKLKTYQKVIERSDKKIENMTKHLQDVEEKTLILNTRRNDIQELKDKFDEIDGLSEVMSKRVDQIYAMFKKVETLREEIDETDVKLQNMFVRTDEKMREFVEFIQAVDTGSPIVKQVNKEMAPGKNMNEHLIRTVRELSGKGWSADAIAKKMLIDENSVRLIINTTSL